MLSHIYSHSPYDISSNLLLEQLKWNNLFVNRQKQKAILICLKHLTVKHLSIYKICLTLELRCQYSLRNSNVKLFIPKPNTDYLKRSFSCSGAFLCNSLPESLRLSPSLTSFKSSLESLYSSRTDSHTATR